MPMHSHEQEIQQKVTNIHGVELKDLPCGGCSYCTRAHMQWSSFMPISRCQLATLSASEEGGDSAASSRTWDPGGKMQPETPTLETVIHRFPDGTTTSQVNILSDEGTKIRVVELGDKRESVWGLLVGEIEQEQIKDPDLRLAISWLKEKLKPSEGELFSSSAAAKFYWINRDRLCLRNSILFIKAKDINQEYLILPQGLREGALRLLHDLPSAGHQGIKFYWYGMGAEVERYVISCETCNQKKKPNRKNRYKLIEYHAGVPMERVHIDFMGPLPNTKQRKSEDPAALFLQHHRGSSAVA